MFMLIQKSNLDDNDCFHKDVCLTARLDAV